MLLDGNTRDRRSVAHATDRPRLARSSTPRYGCHAASPSVLHAFDAQAKPAPACARGVAGIPNFILSLGEGIGPGDLSR